LNYETMIPLSQHAGVESAQK